MKASILLNKVCLNCILKQFEGLEVCSFSSLLPYTQFDQSTQINSLSRISSKARGQVVMQANKATKLIKPTSNIIQISSKRDTGFYVFLSKLFLMDFPDIELHALGDAITICVKVGELLCRYGYTAIERIETTTITPDEAEREGDRNFRRGKKAKLIVKLKKGPNFAELIKNFRIQKN